LGILFPALLKTLSDPADHVVRLDLEVMARISLNDDYFNHLMQSLVVLFRSDPLV
jgi:vacuole morphology and inheritance protein 14